MAQFGSAMNSGHIDGNQNPSIIGVIGTMGTADTGGTALTLPIAVDPTTGAMYVNNLGAGGGGGGSNVNVFTGTQQTLGTVGTVLGIGSITNIGTVGTIVGFASGTNVNLVTGTLNTLIAGTLNSIAIQTGTLGTVGTAGDGGRGTLLTDSNNALWTNLGYKLDSTNDSVTAVIGGGTLVDGTITTVNNLTNGTVRVSVGTITTGTLQNLVSGTFNAGTVVMTVGTLTTGTLQNLVSGTFNTGTVVNNGGTLQLNMTPVASGTSYGTVGTTGAAGWGTLVAASGAGTKQYVAGVDIVVVSGTVEVAVTNIGVGGSTGNGVLARGNFPAGGGISKNFNPVQVSGTNGTISYWLGGAGTVDIVTQFWQGV